MKEKLIDIKDKKILAIIDMDARTPHARIGKLVGLSRKSIDYRLKRLEKLDIIKGYFPRINHFKLGLSFFRIFIKLHNLDPLIEDGIIEFCKSREIFNYIHSYRGRFDFGMGVIVKNKKEFMVFVENLMEKFGKHISEKFLSEAIELGALSHSYIHENKRVMHSSITQDIIIIDEIDKKILEMLKDDCKMSIVMMADKLNLSNTAISRRIELMVKNNVIECFRAQINFLRLGFIYYKIYMSLSDPKKDRNELIKHIENLNCSIFTTVSIGNYDLEFELVLNNTKEFYEIMREIESKFRVSNFDYVIGESIERIKSISL